MWFFNKNKKMSFKKRLKLATNKKWVAGELTIDDRTVEVDVYRRYNWYSECTTYKAKVIENGWYFEAYSLSSLINKIKRAYRNHDLMKLDYDRKIN